MIKCNNTVVKVVLATVFLCAGLFSSCSKNKVTSNRIVIWTDNSEFAQYAEYFNSTHTDDKVVLVYKENPALSLPPAKDERPPDIVVGSWLRTDSTQKYFKALDYIFDTKKLTSSMFYPQLIEAGKVKHTQYLLPVSFNLPAIIFANENKNLVPDSYTLTLDQIRHTASEYNSKNKKEAYTRIGFTPTSNSDFLYLVTKLKGANFRDEKGQITWNDFRLDESTNYIRDWVNTENTSAQIEQDFAFKYLFMPYYRQVSIGRTLYAYTTSNELFKVMKDQTLDIDYRWIAQDKLIPAEDNMTMMGIYKTARNQVGATEFMVWFCQSVTQQNILERKYQLNLQTEKFGIAGGFSAVRDVTEHILPVYYTPLLSNLPPAQMIQVPQKLPARWTGYQSQVVEQYVKAAVTEDTNSLKIEDFEKEYRKKFYD